MVQQKLPYGIVRRQRTSQYLRLLSIRESPQGIAELFDFLRKGYIAESGTATSTQFLLINFSDFIQVI